MDDSNQVFNLSNRNHSMQFDVQSNAVYEVHIRAENHIGFSVWTKEQYTTTAGTVKICIIHIVLLDVAVVAFTVVFYLIK